MKRFVIVTALVASTLTAHAGRRNPTTALVLSGVGTGVASGLFVSSFMFRAENHDVNKPLLYSGLGLSAITPSLGEWYAGQWFTIGMGVRTGAALLAAYGITMTEDVRCLAAGIQTCKELTGGGLAVLGVAAVAFIGGAAYDVMDADDAALRYNARHMNVIITPLVLPRGGGFELTGTF